MNSQSGAYRRIHKGLLFEEYIQITGWHLYERNILGIEIHV